MSFPSSISGTGYKGFSIPTKSPQQMDLFNFLTGGATEGLRGGGFDFLNKLASGDQSQFAQMEAPALRQFGQLQGNTASRFSGQGSGARSSSSFQNAMGEASADLAERLKGQRMGLQQGAVEQLLALYNSLLGQNLHENFLMPKKKPFWQEFLLGATPGLAQGGSQAGLLALLSKPGLMG